MEFWILVICCLQLFTACSAIQCYQCTYLHLSSDNSLWDTLISSSNTGSSSCWGTYPSALVTCSSIYSTCTTVRVDMTVTLSGFGTMKYRAAIKTCGAGSGDYCQAENLDSYIRTLSIFSGYSTSGSGHVSLCACDTDGCNSGKMMAYTPALFLVVLIAALKNVF